MAKKILSIRVEEKTTLIVHMEYQTSNPTIYGCMRVPTPEGAVEDGMIKDAIAIGRRIRKTCEEKGIKTKDVVFTIASSKIANREITIPVVNKSKIQALIEAKADDYFPVDVNKYSFAFAQPGKDRVSEDGKVYDLLVFAAPNSLIESYYVLAETCNFNILSLDCDGNSVFQIMKKQISSKVAMAIQINRLNTLVNIMDGDKLLLQRSITYGIGNVTDFMISDNAFDVNNYESAYELLATKKVILDSFEPLSPGADASHHKRYEVTEMFGALISNIGRIVEYYNSKYKENPIGEIICTGAGASCVGVHELFRKEIGIPTFTPKELRGVRFVRKIVLDRNILQYVGCFGATFSSVGFIPKELAKKQNEKGTLFGAYMVLAASILFCVVLAGFSIMQLIDANARQDAITSRVNVLKPIEAEYTAYKDVEMKYTDTQLLEAALSTTNNRMYDMIKKFNKVLPTNARVNSLVTTQTSVTMDITMTDKLSAVSALITSIEGLPGTAEDVKVSDVAKANDEISARKQYVFTVTFNFYEEAADAEEGTTADDGVAAEDTSQQ